MTEPEPLYGHGERVRLTMDVPETLFDKMAFEGETGTVRFSGPWMHGYRPVGVRLDRTEDILIVLEQHLAPE